MKAMKAVKPVKAMKAMKAMQKKVMKVAKSLTFAKAQKIAKKKVAAKRMGSMRHKTSDVKSGRDRKRRRSIRAESDKTETFSHSAASELQEPELRYGSGQRIETHAPNRLPDSQLLQLVCKCLEALDSGVFDPEGENLNRDWTAANAPLVPLQRRRPLVTTACLACTSRLPSTSAMLHFASLLGREFVKAESWSMLNLNMLQRFDPGLKALKNKLTPLLVRTSGLVSLPQLPPPQPLLLARNWSHHGYANGLSSSLWLHVALFLAPARGQRLWETGLHPLAFLLQNENQRVNGVCLLEPPGVSAARFLGNPLLQSLWVNDVATSTRSWEEASQDALHQLLSRLAGVSREALQEHTDLDISTVVQAAGVCHRLQSNIPVLLVGDFSASVDVAFAKLVGAMLGISEQLVAVDTTDGDGSVVGFDEICSHIRPSDRSPHPLLLARCSEESLKSQAGSKCLGLLHKILIDRCCSKAFTLGALHCVHTSTLELQRRLPAPLREAVVFF